jgi:hypothetical protein
MANDVCYWVIRSERGDGELSIPCPNGRIPHGHREQVAVLVDYVISLLNRGRSDRAFSSLYKEVDSASDWNHEFRKLTFLHDTLERARRKVYQMHALNAFVTRSLRIWLAKSVVDGEREKHDAVGIYKRIYSASDLLDSKIYSDEGVSAFYEDIVRAKILSSNHFVVMQNHTVLPSTDDLASAGYVHTADVEEFWRKVDMIRKSEEELLRKHDPSRSLKRDIEDLAQRCHVKGRTRMRRERISESRDAWSEMANKREQEIIAIAQAILSISPSLTRSSLTDRVRRKMQASGLQVLGKSTINDKLRRAGLPPPVTNNDEGNTDLFSEEG